MNGITSSRASDDAEIVISVSGRFDFSLQRDFRDAYQGHTGPNDTFRVDLSRTEYLDSAALGMLLLLREHVGGDTSRVKISGATPAVDKLLRIANFHQLFQL